MKKIRFLCVLLLVTSFAQAKSYRGTKTSFAALKPSHESLLQQNYVIDQQHWVRIRDERELSRAIDAGRLVNIPASETLTIATSLPANRRYVLPHVSVFLGQLSGDYYAVFGKPLQIDSAVRPVSVQTKLRRYNRNAAPAEGETASSHESGATVDFAKRTMSTTQRRWFEFRLAYYMYARHIVLVEEESNCYHVMVIPEEEQ